MCRWFLTGVCTSYSKTLAASEPSFPKIEKLAMRLQRSCCSTLRWLISFSLGVRTLLLRISLVAIAMIASAQSQTAKRTVEGGDSIPKGAVHLFANSDAKARQIFTYFPYPQLPDGYWTGGRTTTGLYRIEVNEQGNVTAVTILKSMGYFLDVTSMKTFVKWRGKPGPLRVVDVPWKVGPRIIYR